MQPRALSASPFALPVNRHIANSLPLRSKAQTRLAHNLSTLPRLCDDRSQLDRPQFNKN
jgi:hypothetical protein